MKVKLTQTALAVSVAVALFMPIAAQADTTQWVDVSQRGQLPTASVSEDETVLFKLENPTSQDMKFQIPSMGLTYRVPAHSQETYHIDMAQVREKELPYQVADQSNRPLAQGKINNEWRFHSNIDLANIINYNTSYNAPSKPAPRYYDKSGVRGYW